MLGSEKGMISKRPFDGNSIKTTLEKNSKDITLSCKINDKEH
jgi:hypothetical protein